MIALALLSLAAWIWLLLAHHRFWHSAPELAARSPNASPAVDVVVPARDEAGTIAASLGSLLDQNYAGEVRIVLVDDRSTDETAVIAQSLADAVAPGRLAVARGRPAPPGWSGKLWALAQGIACTSAEFLLLSDADIVHAPGHLAAMMAKVEAGSLDLASEMVALRCESLPERALVPAFVFFFQLLYPFAAVNDPKRKVAAAAGGAMLVRRSALERIGGIAAIKGALIDDVALAAAIKPGGRIWLGHSALARSLRAYPAFADIRRMVARTAFVQLRFSALLLIGTALGMSLLFFTPPLSVLFGAPAAKLVGLIAWSLSAALYAPTLRRFHRSFLWAAFLPLIGGFYLAATIGSALDHWRGRGVVWKGRAYGSAYR